MTTSDSATAEPAQLRAADGYVLGATRFAATAPLRARVVMAGATGVPQGFYRRFATFAAARGFETLTFDYRGIGRSAPRTLRGFRADYLDWARLDLAAAVDALQGDAPVVMMAHSFGGHALGLLPNHHKVRACHVFATGAGWDGWMPPLERVRVRALWNVLGPALVRWKGYLPWSMLGMGEDLPLGVYRQWKRWCAYPHYFFDDPEFGAEMAERFGRVRTPITAANALDDLWAPPASRDAFIAGYRNAPVTRMDIDPARAGIGPIGHMGYFRAPAAPLWDAALTWLAAQATHAT